MKISARTRYGLRILMDIAQRPNTSTPRRIADIAQAQDISAAFISRLSVPLRRAGIINAERGVGGGLSLAKPPDSISLLEIAETLDGPLSILKCLAKPGSCKRHDSCRARCAWNGLNEVIRSAFASMSLSAIMTDPDSIDNFCI